MLVQIDLSLSSNGYCFNAMQCYLGHGCMIHKLIMLLVCTKLQGRTEQKIAIGFVLETQRVPLLNGNNVSSTCRHVQVSIYKQLNIAAPAPFELMVATKECSIHENTHSKTQ